MQVMEWILKIIRSCSRAAFSHFFLWFFAFSLLNPGAFGDDVGPTTATFEQQLTTAEATATHLIEWPSDWTTANSKDISEEERPSTAFANSLAEDAVTREPDNSTRETEHAGSTVGLSVAGPRGDSDDGHVTPPESVARRSNAVDSETTGSTTETTVSRENGATRATNATDATDNETTRFDDNGVETSHGGATHATTTASDYATATTATTATTIATTAHSDVISTLTPTANIDTPSATVHVPAEPAATTATTTATATTPVPSEIDLAEDNSVTIETTAGEEQLLTETDEQNRATEVATAVVFGDNEIFPGIPRSQQKTTELVSGATETTTTTATTPSLFRGSTNSTDNGATVKTTTTTQLRGTTNSNTADAFFSSNLPSQTSTFASTETSTVASTETSTAASTETSTATSTAAALNPVLTFSFSCLSFVFMRKMA